MRLAQTLQFELELNRSAQLEIFAGQVSIVSSNSIVLTTISLTN